MIENISLINIDEKLVLKGKIYYKNQLPGQIGHAIYLFGNENILDVLAFIDASDELDGSKGMIITPDAIYFQLGLAGCIYYDEITSLSLQKHHCDSLIKTIVRTKSGNYAFSNKIINPEVLVCLLSDITGLNVELVMTCYEKIAYYVPIVLKDLLEELYEDIKLTIEQIKFINELFQELEIIENLDYENYCYELEKLYPRIMNFFEDLGLDSDEIDELYKIQEQLLEVNQDENRKIEEAKQLYDEMINQYNQGNTEIVDQVKAMMTQLGINEDELAGKSMEEIEDLLCDRLGISKELMEKMMRRFSYGR